MNGENEMVVYLAAALAVAVLALSAVVALVCWLAFRRDPNKELIASLRDQCDRTMARDWPSYAGFLMQQPGMIAPYQHRAGTPQKKRPPITRATDDPGELDEDGAETRGVV
jgi:hypothetical protein